MTISCLVMHNYLFHYRVSAGTHARDHVKRSREAAALTAVIAKKKKKKQEFQFFPLRNIQRSDTLFE